MNWPQLINTLVFVIGTFIGLLQAFHVSRILGLRLPDHIAVRLEQFARMAVWQVEQQSGSLSGTAKKELAIASVTKLFYTFHLPAPPPQAIDIAIESAVHFLSRATVVESDNPPKLESPKQSG